jgi:hypothetical protein
MSSSWQRGSHSWRMCSSECGMSGARSDGTECASCCDAYLHKGRGHGRDQATRNTDAAGACISSSLLAAPGCDHKSHTTCIIYNKPLTEASCSLSLLSHGSDFVESGRNRLLETCDAKSDQSSSRTVYVTSTPDAAALQTAAQWLLFSLQHARSGCSPGLCRFHSDAKEAETLAACCFARQPSPALAEV